MTPQIDYLPDDSVDAALDQEIRGLLKTCFTKPQDVVFGERRYFREPYPHRWVIRNAQGRLVAHIGVHEKLIHAEGTTFHTGGICEVCVHPDYRGRGYVRLMLEHIHNWLASHAYSFCALFGNPRVYGSSGYTRVSNLYIGGEEQGWRAADGLVTALPGARWPTGKALMPGPGF